MNRKIKDAFTAINSGDEGRVCKDIPDSACKEEPKNIVLHIFSLCMTKTADSLVDPKLILSWVLVNGGASAFFIGLLVPIREAGALVPQLFSAGFIRSMAQRKYAWALASFVQGLSAFGLGLSALYLSGKYLGIGIVVNLSLLAIARSVCSVSYKDVLGKTVDKSKRGKATGLASTLAAICIIVYALSIAFSIFDKKTLVLSGLFLASGFWLLGACGFLMLKEDKGATEGGKNAIDALKPQLNCLVSNKQLRLFIGARACLLSSALAPPFLVALFFTQTESSQIGSSTQSGLMNGQLGLLVLASAFASLLSSYFWGSFADRSSRKVLIVAGLLTAIVLAIGATLGFYNAYFQTQSFTKSGQMWMLPALVFLLMIAYEGVRLGRNTYLIDMAKPDQRAIFTALSNTIIGILLIAAGSISIVAYYTSVPLVLALLSILSFISIIFSYKLNEV